jgi:hypothetical protein
MMPNPVKRSPISGGQMVAALVAIVIATAVVPPAAAWALNKSRVAQTQERVRAAIDRLRSNPANIAKWSSSGIVCGPGRLPDPEASVARNRFPIAAHAAWLREAKIAPELFGAGMPTDAWGRCFLLNAGDPASSGPIWLLSAGPNGLIDTPPDAAALSGDDIGGRVR